MFWKIKCGYKTKRKAETNTINSMENYRLYELYKLYEDLGLNLQ